jgi:hypothetical protein
MVKLKVLMCRLYEEELRASEPDITAKEIESRRDSKFAPWLQNKVSTVKLIKINKYI